jgi:hypothetical protein
MTASGRRDARAYHTRLGWWVMTHERGGPAVIGATATAILVGDLGYSLSHWSGSFPRSFLFNLAFAAVAALSGLLVGSDPRRQRIGWAAALVVLGIWAWFNPGGSYGGAICGILAFAAGGVLLFSARWLRGTGT